MKIYLRPPRGVFPRWLWQEMLEVPSQPSEDELIERRQMVQDAVDRYVAAGQNPLPIWLHELSTLI